MNNIYTLLAAAAISGLSSLSAQQLANNGFEGAWKTATPFTSSTAKAITIGENPENWVISHVTGTTGSFLNGTGKAALGTRVAGYNSEKAVELKNTSTGAMGITRNVPGYLTTGTTWSTAVSTNKTDGGTFGSIPFSNRPDAVTAMYKRTFGTENTENATVVAYLWKGQWVQKDVPAAIVISGNPNKINMIDRDRCVLGYSLEGCQGGEITETGELIGKVIYYIEGAHEDWTEVEVPIEYVSDATPEKFNVIFSANDYFTTTVGKENTLTVDDVILVYYSRLASLKYDGSEVPGFDPDVYNYDLSSIQMPDDASKVAYTLKGTSGVAKAATSIDAENNRILITVSNPQGTDKDGKNEHVYTIQFGAKAVAATSITLDQTSLNLKPGETAALTATVLPANATDKTVTWASENAMVAQVKDGVVTAVNPGETTITASCNGLTATCTVVVESEQPRPEFPAEYTVFEGTLVIEMMGGQINEGDLTNYYVLLAPPEGAGSQARV
ncbi:MAG: Ig-like domain-containing protein, partial [Muribaculaceae bacterium]|nr:Ig-like domain-containing protein [Muribaculaceae bacterium]